MIECEDPGRLSRCDEQVLKNEGLQNHPSSHKSKTQARFLNW